MQVFDVPSRSVSSSSANPLKVSFWSQSCSPICRPLPSVTECQHCGLLLLKLLFPEEKNQQTYEVGSVVSQFSMLGLLKQSQQNQQVQETCKARTPEANTCISSDVQSSMELCPRQLNILSWNVDGWGMKLKAYIQSLLTPLQNDSFIRKLYFQELIPSSSRIGSHFYVAIHSFYLFHHKCNCDIRNYRLILLFRSIAPPLRCINIQECELQREKFI